VQLLKLELQIQLNELQEQWHFASLERIFIENRIYRDIEDQETWPGVIEAIDKGLQPHIKHLKRAITEEDITRLTEIRIKRISKFDIDKAQQKIDALEGEIAEKKYHLENLIDYAIAYFDRLKKTYGKGKERQTELRLFEDIEATKVVMRNTKLYVNREEGFVGTSLKKDEYVADCADIDDIICFTKEGKLVVSRVGSKTFIGKNIIHVAVFKKKDKRTVYNMIYKDGRGGASYVKRFSVTSITRDKEYDLTQGKKGSEVLYFTANPNGEAELVSIYLRQPGSVRKLNFNLDFSVLLIKGRGVKGNKVTSHQVKKIEKIKEGVSTLQARKIWFDETVRRLNVDGRGELLGEFEGEDKLLIINQKGEVKTITPEVTLHFDNDMIVLEKWIPEKPISAIHYEGEKERYYLKRFVIENSSKEETTITSHENSYLELISTDYLPQIEIVFKKIRGKDQKPDEVINVAEFISVKGIKALGNQLTSEKVKQISLLEPLLYEEKPSETENRTDVGSEVDNGTIEKISPDDEKDGQTALF